MTTRRPVESFSFPVEKIKEGYYTDAYKIFADECPYLGLYTSSDVYAVSDKFTYDPSTMFWYNFSYADVHVAK